MKGEVRMAPVVTGQGTAQKPAISVVLPVYNEEKSLHLLFERLIKELSRM